MSTWQDLSDESRRAAQALYKGRMFRSSINRAYFAAYAAITQQLKGRITFPQGRGNPPHAGLTRYVQNVLTDLPPWARSDIKHKIRVLYKARVSADYLPADPCDERLAKQALREAAGIIEQLG
jgi:uncharacterized protein (UPF0332 family)